MDKIKVNEQGLLFAMITMACVIALLGGVYIGLNSAGNQCNCNEKLRFCEGGETTTNIPIYGTPIFANASD
jgi:hypothetical protein